MEIAAEQVVQFLLLFMGGVCLAWGGFIIGNERFYKWWRDRYWKEPKDAHLSSGATFVNRYVEGTGMIGLGVVLVYVALSIH